MTYHGDVKEASLTVRKVSAGVAGFLQELELRQPVVVTRALMQEVIAAAGSPMDPGAATERLVREGWLLPLRTRDAWEFAPASRAGRISSGDRWLELRALLVHQPDAPVGVAFASAVWEFGFSMHPPSRSTLAHARGWRPPVALDDVTTVTYSWRLPTANIDGLPVWQPATIVVAAADMPRWQLDWGNADTWLPETMRAAARQDIMIETESRALATRVRLGYFAEWSGRHDVAREVRSQLPEKLPVTYLGPRQPRGRWVSEWRLYDALLPDR